MPTSPFPTLTDELWGEVIAHPHDFHRRAACARHLADVGDPWARIIEAQLLEHELFWNGDLAFESAMSSDLRELERELFDDWTGPVFRYSQDRRFKHASGAVRRGFVEQISVRAEVFVNRWTDIRSLAPIRSLAVWDVGSGAERLGRCAGLEGIIGLELEDPTFDDEDLKALGRGGRLSHLKYLSLYFSNAITRAGVEYLAAEQPLPSLRELKVRVKGLDISEVVDDGYDRQLGNYQHYGPSRDADELEAKYGYQAWLHPCAQTPLNIAPGPSMY